MLHEKQVRQLCAVHTVNNLLQIPSDFDWCEFDGDAKSSNDADTCYSAGITPESNAPENNHCKIHWWTCNGRVLHEFEQPSSISTAVDKRWRAATQIEFDEIARKITICERLLMEGKLSITWSDENDQTSDVYKSSSKHNLSALQRIFSNHGTPFLGNYSLEVMQVALKRRGVVMNFFHVPEDDSDVEDDDDACNTSKMSSVHIGYIVYDQKQSFSSYLKRLGRYVPILKHFCEGKHWYSITRVCYHCKEITDSSKNHKPNFNEDEFDRTKNKSAVPWCLIDSKLDEILVYDSDMQLMKYLRQIQKSGGLVFRASFCILPSADAEKI